MGSENSREELEELFDSLGLRRRRSWCEQVAAKGDLRQSGIRAGASLLSIEETEIHHATSKRKEVT